MRIIGIDPGSRYTGYGIVQKDGQELTHLASGRINATGAETFNERLEIIYDGLHQVLEEWSADEAAIESIFTAHNARSTIKLGQARGVAVLALRHLQLEVHDYAPALVKKNTTGNGRAPKRQVMRMVEMRLNLEGKLTEDAADALAVAICHSQAAGFKQRLA